LAESEVRPESSGEERKHPGFLGDVKLVNPFPVTDGRHEKWKEILALIEEQQALFDATMVERIATEKDDSDNFAGLSIEGMIGRFDINAGAIATLFPLSDFGAKHYEQTLTTFEAGTLEHARRHRKSPHLDRILEEAKARLWGRKRHWVGQLLGQIRQYRTENENSFGGRLENVLPINQTAGNECSTDAYKGNMNLSAGDSAIPSKSDDPANEISYLKAPNFRYQYPSDFPADEQNSIETARLRGNQELTGKAITSYVEYKATRSKWLWLVVTTAAGAIGRAGITHTWPANRRREMLRDFALEAAQAVSITGPAFQRLVDCNAWHSLDDLLFVPAGSSGSGEPAAWMFEDSGMEGSLPSGATSKKTGAEIETVRRRKRKPDLGTSRERIHFAETLARELATIKTELTSYWTPDALRKKYSDFTLWAQLRPEELKEITDGVAFMPKAYADNLTLRKFGLTSRETLKKDRSKLKQAARDSA
jgi:hypothetical protein